VSFAAITLCVASQRVFIFVSIHFVIDSVRKLLDTPSYRYVTKVTVLECKVVLSFYLLFCMGVKRSLTLTEEHKLGCLRIKWCREYLVVIGGWWKLIFIIWSC